jgi:hypothetical protein
MASFDILHARALRIGRKFYILKISFITFKMWLLFNKISQYSLSPPLSHEIMNGSRLGPFASF